MTKFKGHDWTELYEALLHKEPREDVDDVFVPDASNLRELQQFISAHALHRPDVLMKMREFLQVLRDTSEDLTYDTPVWDGLLAVEDEETFVQHYVTLLPAMWT